MLASEPLSTRVHTRAGGKISVRVNGSSFETSGNSNSSSAAINGSTVESSRNSETDTENKQKTGWANATITWRSGAQPFTGTSKDDVSNSILSSKTAIVSAPQMVRQESVSDENDSESQPQLIHVIRVQGTSPSTHDSALSDRATDLHTFGSGAKNVSSACIRITSTPSNLYSLSEDSYHRNEKIIVGVHPPLGHIMKGEDERSSSGASSAPGSDCERSDSDREGDDGTDSGFSPSRRPCTSIIVSAKNTINLSENYVPEHNNVVNNSSLGDGEPSRVSSSSSDKGNVKLTIGSYADKETKDSVALRQDSGEQWDMHFHLRELDRTSADKDQTEDVQTKIAAAHALLAGQGGTNTLKNRIRTSIVSLLVQSATNRNYEQEEVGRIVFYATTMGIVRNTFERCRKVRKILETLMVKFEERDVFMNRGFQQEVRERLGSTKVDVPQVFVEGRYLGSVEVLEQLNEIGHLREFLRPYKRKSVGGTCQQCGGYRYLLCSICGGSKKSATHRHHFSDDLVALRCVSCDESGLVRCSQCINGEV